VWSPRALPTSSSKLSARLLSVIRDRCRGSCLPVDVRSAPKGTEVLRCRKITRWESFASGFRITEMGILRLLFQYAPLSTFAFSTRKRSGQRSGAGVIRRNRGHAACDRKSGVAFLFASVGRCQRQVDEDYKQAAALAALAAFYRHARLGAMKLAGDPNNPVRFKDDGDRLRVA
jgi:hypothetical protein